MERFLWHASQVRTIRCDLREGQEYHEQLVQIVFDRNGKKGIFTRLHTMDCNMHTLDEAYIFSLSTTALTNINITLPPWRDVSRFGELIEKCNASPDIVQILGEILRISPYLTSLALNTQLDEDSTRALLRFPHLNTLRRVKITSPAVFVTLLNEPKLVSLYLKCDTLTFEPPLKHLPLVLRSEHLVELSLRGPCATLTPIFLALRAPLLRQAHLVVIDRRLYRDGIRRPSDTAIYTTCMRAFVEAVPGLEELSLSLQVYWTLSLEETLAPILSLRTIRRFVYGRDSRVLGHVGTDAAFAAIAQAWGGGLEVLRFERCWWERMGPAPSAVALSSIRASCPRLVDLLLPPLDPSLEKLAKVDARGSDGHVHPLDMLSIMLWKTRSKDITDDMRGRWEAYLTRLFPKVAGGEGNKELLVGELPDSDEIPIRAPRRPLYEEVIDTESESSDDEALADGSASRHSFHS